MRRLSLFLVLGLVIISLVGCGEVEKQKKVSPDGSKVTVDATGTPSKEIMMGDIQNKLLEGYKQVADEEAEILSGYDLVTPKYLPERFQHYGVFIQDNPGIPTEKMVKQLWYDAEKLEVLMITEMKGDSTSPEGRITFTEDLEVPGKIRDIYTWAKYRCQYEFTKNRISVQGYMLVNDEGNRDEYERILKSLNEFPE